MRSIATPTGKWLRRLAAGSMWLRRLAAGSMWLRRLAADRQVAQASLPKNRAQEIHPMIYGMDFGGKRTHRKERYTAAPSL